MPRIWREIALAREYRARLVTDVVTGKLDVREAAAQPARRTEERLPAWDDAPPAGESPRMNRISRADSQGLKRDTDTSEKGLESLIVAWMTGQAAPQTHAQVQEARPPYGGEWLLGDARDYVREYCVDLAQLSAFLRETQADAAEALDLDDDSPTRRKFLDRLQGEVSKRGVIDVLRHGVKHGPHQLDLFYGTPSPGNPAAAERYAQNRFSVTRQLRYSRDETQLALDLGLFINGLPVATFELKNSLTKQTVGGRH